ncbi:hypothetical protein O7626_39555 [Micromonospora sp. WMMD1102]|nr:hypothetical protein [Micromonospora sp. WMMD1102]MDG4784336.1 hypothetical protein [Micromonospora sp. WMMD1102]MDG4784409.1 hypothetical protein [Micromonospora sp. WMMD1102]MDG4791913.1 hypothetical protein [Micromonospora sp. WMMD1102]
MTHPPTRPWALACGICLRLRRAVRGWLICDQCDRPIPTGKEA